MGILNILAKRFITGETVESAIAAVQRLNQAGMWATLDILGENVTNKDQAVKAANAYIDLLQVIADSGIISNVSLKLTQMGLDISEEFCFDNVSRILEKAGQVKNFVRIDMESSAYTEATLRLIYRWHEEFAHVGAVLQACLYRSVDDVQECNRRKITVRLCKGAYKEPKEVAYQAKEQVNANFVKLADMLLKDGMYPAIATHDEKMIAAAMQSAADYGRSKDDFEFQMLYGINRAGQRRLVQQGFRMRVYTPFGTHWLPYYLRRLRERKENILFLARHLFKD